MDALNTIGSVLYLPPVRTRQYKYAALNKPAGGTHADERKRSIRREFISETRHDVVDANLLTYIINHNTQQHIDVSPLFARPTTSSRTVFEVFNTLSPEAMEDAKTKALSEEASAWGLTTPPRKGTRHSCNALVGPKTATSLSGKVPKRRSTISFQEAAKETKMGTETSPKKRDSRYNLLFESDTKEGTSRRVKQAHQNVQEILRARNRYMQKWDSLNELFRRQAPKIPYAKAEKPTEKSEEEGHVMGCDERLQMELGKLSDAMERKRGEKPTHILMLKHLRGFHKKNAVVRHQSSNNSDFA